MLNKRSLSYTKGSKSPVSKLMHCESVERHPFCLTRGFFRQATKQHLEEELSMRVAYALQTERNYQLQVVELRNENEKMKELLNQDDHSSSASPSTEHHQHSVSHAPFDSSRSVCSMLREMFCWPLHAMFRVLHPTEDQHDVRGVPYATKRRDLLHNDHNGLICCRRRPRVENGTSLLEETIL
eukprot:Blabericola_migrator_1__2014@NODE_154_length_12740_cov_225_658329_g135_i0_p6_GENE_NODE_154_length_12740_cov_225_658329_g135_i0NODE_154_length_12740_cov_225_658329_g135_i0_p6_ORF_typecomplete_len183_score13_89Nab1/PF04902_12/0_0059SAdoMet_synt_C/PF02773_16/3_2e03SAdoMet_synt_C/PF02773_16/0_28DUF4606/PF15379_6/2_5e02DUF4606/PF15379_6/1_9_NODE_154_length_12740_cov_225_658329_g135_i01549